MGDWYLRKVHRKRSELGEDEVGNTGREARGLVTDTDTAVLILDIYLAWWRGDGSLVEGGRSSSRLQERLAAMRFGSLFSGKSFFKLLQSSLAGARGGQVVAVLVLGPKPQPLLVLLLWFFGSVFS